MRKRPARMMCREIRRTHHLLIRAVQKQLGHPAWKTARDRDREHEQKWVGAEEGEVPSSQKKSDTRRLQVHGDAVPLAMLHILPQEALDLHHATGAHARQP